MISVNKHRPCKYLPVLITAALLTVMSGMASAQLYRYTNDKGVTVIDDKVPPEFIPNGYDVLGANGALIRRVDRQLSEEELKSRNSTEARKRLREEEEMRMQSWDQSLLLRYSSVDDIEAAKKRARRDLEIRISILKSNLASTKSQIEREQKRAADIERRGAMVPEELSKNIATMRLEIEDIEQSIKLRRVEVDQSNASFESDIARFKTLIDRVEMRRAHSPTSESNYRGYY